MLGEEKLIVMADKLRDRRKDPTTRPETTHRWDLFDRPSLSDWPV